MRFIIMHKTNAHWEAGAIPSPELIGRVGALLGELARAGVLLAGGRSPRQLGRCAAHVFGGTRTVSTVPSTAATSCPPVQHPAAVAR